VQQAKVNACAYNSVRSNTAAIVESSIEKLRKSNIRYYTVSHALVYKYNYCIIGK